MQKWKRKKLKENRAKEKEKREGEIHQKGEKKVEKRLELWKVKIERLTIKGKHTNKLRGK